MVPISSDLECLRFLGHRVIKPIDVLTRDLFAIAKFLLNISNPTCRVINKANRFETL